MVPSTQLGTSQTPTKAPTNGFYNRAHGTWYCNCVPRLPAIQLRATRDTPNKGRWFYKCPIDWAKGRPGHPEHCGFFLWAEDALKRQEAVDGMSPTKKFKQTTLSTSVLPRAEGPRGGRLDITPIAELERQVNGKRGDAEAEAERSSDVVPASTATMRESGDKSSSSAKSGANGDVEDLFGSDIDADAEFSAAGPSTATSGHAREMTPSTGSKRKRVSFHIDSEQEMDYGEWSSSEETQMIALADSAVQSKGGKTRDAFSTPVSQRTTEMVGGMPTPSLTGTLTGKPLRRNLFSNPSEETQLTGKKQRIDESGGHANQELANPHISTPSSSPSGAAPRTPGSGPALTNVAQEVVALLRDQKIAGSVLQEVERLLEKQVAFAKGLERGRDASRQAAKRAEAKNAQLQQRIADLENRRKLDAEARRKIKGGLMNLYNEN